MGTGVLAQAAVLATKIYIISSYHLFIVLGEMSSELLTSKFV